MSSESDRVVAAVSDIFTAPWSRRTATNVPESVDIVLRNGAVDVDATYLYADLADSSFLAQRLRPEAAARIMRAYLAASARIIKSYLGEIRSFDGDRVMGIYIGEGKDDLAVRTALAINWAVANVIQPMIETTWSDVKDIYSIKHGVGIDSGDAFLVRGGVRNDNDLISVGAAPNVAAKLSDVRSPFGSSLYITDRVFNAIDDEVKFAESKPMWRRAGFIEVGGLRHEYFSSGWFWAP